MNEKEGKIKRKKENPMTKPRIEKVVINIGVGEGGERLKKAEKVLESLTGQKPVRTISKTTNKEWGIRKGIPIGCKVTLRGERAEKFLKEALWTRNNRIAEWSFDANGNLSFGISDHTNFKGQKYDPEIGIFGMDISVALEKPGYRIKKRKIARKKVPLKHRVNREEGIRYLSNKFNIEVV
jgi:large subunit ribosomal protein L5